MTQFKESQEVMIETGSYAGQKGWFVNVSKRKGGEYCFVQLKTPNFQAVQVKLNDIKPV